MPTQRVESFRASTTSIVEQLMGEVVLILWGQIDYCCYVHIV